MPMNRPAIASQSQNISENAHVKELLTILRENNSPSEKNLLAMLQHVNQMEKQLDTAVHELAAMRQELAKVKDQSHPVRTAMQKAVITMQGQVKKLRANISNLKQNIIEGCKDSVSAFKEKGISALDNLSRFFKVRPVLEHMRSDLTKSIQRDDKAIAMIEAISAEYHEAGRHLKNMGRAVIGKEAIQESKPMGMIAKAFIAPSRAERNCLSSILNSVEKSLAAMDRLEERAGHKPSLKETIQANAEKIAQESKAAPAAERPAPSLHEH